MTKVVPAIHGRRLDRYPRAAAVGMGLILTVLLSTGMTASASSEGSTLPPLHISGVSTPIAENLSLHSQVPATYIKNGVQAAVYNDWEPDEFIQNGHLVGWSVDLAKAMAQTMGVKFSYTSSTFDAIIPGLQNGRFNLAYSSLAPTPARLQVVDMVPEQTDGSVYASLKTSHIDIASIPDLCGKQIAVLVGAYDFQYLTKTSASVCVASGKPAIKIIQYPTESEALLAMESRRVELVSSNTTQLLYLANTDPNINVSKLLTTPIYNCIGVTKGSSLDPVLVKALQDLINNGVYQEIMTKWGVNKQGMLTKAVLVTASDPNPQQ